MENVSTLNSTIVLIIKNILQDKEIEFVSEPLGVKHNSEEYFGRVKTIFFRVKFLSDANKYMMDVKLYEQNQSEEMIRVDCAKPIKVYSKPTEFEEYLEFLDSASKFNL